MSSREVYRVVRHACIVGLPVLVASVLFGCGPEASSDGGIGALADLADQPSAAAGTDNGTASGAGGGVSHAPAFVTNPSQAATVVAGAQVIVTPAGGSSQNGGGGATTGDGNVGPDTGDPNDLIPPPGDPNQMITPSGDTGDPEDPPPTDPNGPVLHVTPLVLDFGETATVMSFTVQNSGIGTMDYSVSTESGWFSLSSQGGSSTGEPDTIVVTLDRQWLIDFTIVYTGAVHVAAAYGAEATVQILATVPVPTPSIVVSHDLLDYGTSAYQLQVELYNENDGSVPYMVSASEPWVILDRNSGAIPSTPGRETITVTVTRCEIGWQAGEYDAYIRIEPSHANSIVIPILVEVPAPPSDAQILSWFSALPPLPKVHYSFPVPWEMLDQPNDPLVYQWARITHTIAMTASASSQTRVDNAVAICKQINATNPAIPCSIVLNFGPYEHVPENTPPTYSGPEVAQDLALMDTLFAAFKTQFETANAAQGTHIALSAVLLDTEKWKAHAWNTDGAAEWNAACKVRYDAAYSIAKSYFPTIETHWYDRGKPIEWGAYFTLEELADACDIEIYNGDDLEYLRYRWMLGWQFSQSMGESNIIAWLNFNGAFYSGLPDGHARWVCGLDYDVANSWQLGQEINWSGFVPPAGQTVPLNWSQAVAMYPGPFDGRFPDFAKHFVAYVKGAANLPLNP